MNIRDEIRKINQQAKMIGQIREEMVDELRETDKYPSNDFQMGTQYIVDRLEKAFDESIDPIQLSVKIGKIIVEEKINR